jgi:hypothetical protein
MKSSSSRFSGYEADTADEHHSGELLPPFPKSGHKRREARAADLMSVTDHFRNTGG